MKPPRAVREEYREEQSGFGPLFDVSVADLRPLSFGEDPPSAKQAARSPEARKAIVQGTACCLMLLSEHPMGLTDNEVIDAYAEAYPRSLAAKGRAGFVRMVIRNWCLCKPNGDTRQWKENNLNLIHQTEVVRINRYTGKPNVVFQFIEPPTEQQFTEWRRLASGADERT